MTTKHNEAALKQNMLARLIVLLTLLASSNQYWTRGKFSNFTITKYQRNQNLDPGVPSFVNTLPKLSQQTYTGSMVVYYKKSSDVVEVKVYYRDLKKDSTKSSEVLKLTFPYSL